MSPQRLVRALLRRVRWVVRPTSRPLRTRPADEDVAERLVDAGVPWEVVRTLNLRQVEGPRLSAWMSRGNRLCVVPGVEVGSRVLGTIVDEGARDALVVLAAGVSDAAYLFVRGAGPTVFIGPGCHLPHSEIHCGGESTIVLVGDATGTWHATLDARNGGRIHAGRDQLWATDVIISTDDMHRIEDAATGARVNTFGGTIRIGAHVWIGRDAMVFGGADIGDGSVVGARAFVRGSSFPPASILGGTPARVLRDGIVWSRDDLP